MDLARPYQQTHAEGYSKGEPSLCPLLFGVASCWSVCRSVQLARRVLQLEKLNSSLRQQLVSEQSKGTGLKQQVGGQS